MRVFLVALSVLIAAPALAEELKRMPNGHGAFIVVVKQACAEPGEGQQPKPYFWTLSYQGKLYSGCYETTTPSPLAK